MKTILRVSCSPRGQAAESWRLSQALLTRLLQRHPGAVVIERVIGGGGLSGIDADYALSQQSLADVSQAGSMARSEALVRELEWADCLIIATPMHNFTVPAALKLWIDHVARARRTFNVGAAGKVGLLADRPVFVTVTSGGWSSGERARQPDFLTPYLTAVLGMVGLHNLKFFSVQGTAASPDALTRTRAETEQQLEACFTS